MKFAQFHEMNNPSHLKWIDAEDFDAVEEYGSGSSIRLKSSDAPVAVHETPDEVQRIVDAAVNS
jgi:hypothetical protein